MLEREPDWAGFLAAGLDPEAHTAIRAAERTGRPLGGAAFTARLNRPWAAPWRGKSRAANPGGQRGRRTHWSEAGSEARGGSDVN